MKKCRLKKAVRVPLSMTNFPVLRFYKRSFRDVPRLKKKKREPAHDKRARTGHIVLIQSGLGGEGFLLKRVWVLLERIILLFFYCTCKGAANDRGSIPLSKVGVSFGN